MTECKLTCQSLGNDHSNKQKVGDHRRFHHHGHHGGNLRGLLGKPHGSTVTSHHRQTEQKGQADPQWFVL